MAVRAIIMVWIEFSLFRSMARNSSIHDAGTVGTGTVIAMAVAVSIAVSIAHVNVITTIERNRNRNRNPVVAIVSQYGATIVFFHLRCVSFSSNVPSLRRQLLL